MLFNSVDHTNCWHWNEETMLTSAVHCGMKPLAVVAYSNCCCTIASTSLHAERLPLLNRSHVPTEQNDHRNMNKTWIQFAENGTALPCRSICSCWPIANIMLVGLVIVLVPKTMYSQGWAVLAASISYLLLSPNLFEMQKKTPRKIIKLSHFDCFVLVAITNLKCELVDVSRSWSSSRNLLSPCSSPCSMRIPPPSVSNIWPTFVRRNFNEAKAWCNCSMFLFFPFFVKHPNWF